MNPNASNHRMTSAAVVSVTSNAVRAISLRVGSSRELALDEFEIVADRIKIRSGLIYLTQRERAFVWHTHVMPEGWGMSGGVPLRARPDLLPARILISPLVAVAVDAAIGLPLV